MNSNHVSARFHLNTILVEMEHDHGTRDTCVHFLECLKGALEHTRFKGAKDVRKQFTDFYDLFTCMKPRMAIIQNYLDDVLERLAKTADAGEDAAALVESMIADVRAAETDNAERNERLKKEAVKLIAHHSTVLIHSHSHTVLETLEMANRTHKKFNVIVAEQDAACTLDILKFLNAHGIPFTVIPEYMLSSVEMDISCMLVGAVTLKHDMHFVVDAGTKALVSEMNAAKIPVRLALTTNKFSYWKTKPALQTLKSVKSVAHPHANFSFERIKFSHDRLPLDQVTSVVTEEGVYTPAQLREAYKTKLEEYKRLHADLAKAHC
jgi:translation initiation factor 2B subunit (eIF-2B alpha/beta/delta family)